MKNFEKIRKILEENRNILEKRFKVKEIGIFGSYLKKNQKDESDLDILVEFHEPVGFFKFLELEEHLEHLLGVKVDLVSRKALKPKIGKHILEEVTFI